jgi:hypothetical protein
VHASERTVLTGGRDKLVRLWAVPFEAGVASAAADGSSSGPQDANDAARQTYRAHRKGVLVATWLGGERTILSADPTAIHVCKSVQGARGGGSD